MKKLTVSLAALVLAACTQTGDYNAAASAQAPGAVVQSIPQTPLSESDVGPLFWDDATRADRFRHMELYYPGLEASPAANPRELPRGAPLPQATQALLRDYLGQNGTAGIMVLHKGKVRFEDYALGLKPTDRWTSFSVAKSLTSTLLGAAIADGHIASLDVPVVEIIPALKGSAYEGVTVGQIATMTSGVAWNEDYTDPDSDVAQMLRIAPVAGESQAVTYAKTLTREAPAGEKWVYKTLETNLLGLIVEEATGMSLAAYARDALVDEVGFAGRLYWMQDLTGGNIGGCCLSLRLSDYARFGQFVLDGGAGVVPQGWFDRAGAPTVAFDELGHGYGYQWWAYPNGFGAQGIFGQSITIMPEQDIVLAIVSNWPRATGQSFAMQRAALTVALEESVE